MPQVSKKILPKEIEERIFQIFWKSIARLNTPLQVKTFLYDLLSSTERMMLAKRLAIALLITRGFDYSTIRNTLKVSSETIARVKMWMDEAGKGYKMAIDGILRDEAINKFWQEIGDAFIAMGHYRAGAEKALREREYKRKKVL